MAVEKEKHPPKQKYEPKVGREFDGIRVVYGEDPHKARIKEIRKLIVVSAVIILVAAIAIRNPQRVEVLSFAIVEGFFDLKPTDSQEETDFE